MTVEPVPLDAPLTGTETPAPLTDAKLPTSSSDADKAEVEKLKKDLLFFKKKASELDNQVFQMRTLLQSGKGFSEALQIETLLDAFMAVCRERYGMVSSSVLLLDDLDPDNVFYRVRAYHGLPDTFIDRNGIEEEMLLFKVPHDQGLLWQVIHQGEVFSVRDLEGRPRFKTAFKKWELEVLGSDIWVPLIRGGEVLGILTLGECEDGVQIEESEYDFLEEIAAVAATNIDSTLKYEKNSRILSNLRTLYDVNQQLANVNDFKQLTKETLATAVNALNAQKANLMLYNKETQQLEIKVVWGNIPKQTRDAINEGRIQTKSFAIGEGVAGKAAQALRPVRLNDKKKIQQVGRNLVYCILSVPLIYGGDVVGVMTLTNKVKQDERGEIILDPLGRFGEDDEQLLLSLADQAGVNLNKTRLYNASITDRLTGLFNARHFEGCLDVAVQQSLKEESPLSLGVVDIDHFKRFNDTYGHQAGDAVLAQVAAMLQNSVREGKKDGAFRYGGEEFCLLMPETEPSAAMDVMEDFRKRVEEAELNFEGQSLKVTVSAGIAVCPKDAESNGKLFESADKALYLSKESGRNQVSLAEDVP